MSVVSTNTSLQMSVPLIFTVSKNIYLQKTICCSWCCILFRHCFSSPTSQQLV